MTDRHPLFQPLVLLGGLLFGFGLAVSEMARPEVVLQFLQLEDLGLVFVMFGGAAVTALAFVLVPRVLDRAPLTGDAYGRRLKTFDSDVVVGGVVFGVGWGISGMCPGAAYASLGIGNLPILWGIAGMFLGAYAQGFWRAARRDGRGDAMADGGEAGEAGEFGASGETNDGSELDDGGATGPVDPPGGR